MQSAPSFRLSVCFHSNFRTKSPITLTFYMCKSLQVTEVRAHIVKGQSAVGATPSEGNSSMRHTRYYRHLLLLVLHLPFN